jgi:uncharacterized protein (TIGR00299 family) protein
LTPATETIMNAICFEPVAGAAGDMILASLFDLGADPAEVDRVLRTGGLDGFAIHFERKPDNHRITCGYCNVALEEHDHDHAHDHEHGHGHEHTHAHEHEHAHAHEHAHEHEHEHAETAPAHEHRGLKEILAIIARSEAPARAKQRAEAIFRRLAAAEAAVHGVAIEEVHFHEVGAVDAIVDIFGICIALEQLGIERVFCSEFKVGHGTIRCAHGVIPVPAPATAKLLEGFPVERLDIRSELTTPTGAAVLTTLTSGDWRGLPLRILRTGAGHGRREFPQRPNMIRAFLVEIAESRTVADTVAVIETDLDDESPEILGALLDSLLAAGALDASYQAVQMKKNRPGARLTVLCPPERAAALSERILTQTSTIGVRVTEARRQTLPRSAQDVETPWGTVRCKRVERPDGPDLIPEFESCRALAEAAQVPLRRVMAAARAAGLEANQA